MPICTVSPHTPLVGFVDPEQAVLDEVNGVIADARRRIAEFDPELVVLFAPDHYNGFFYDVMPPFCLGVGATAIGDFASAAGDLPVPAELAEACAHAILNSGIDLAVSYNMRVDHGFAQPLEFLLGGLDRVPVLPVFINGVAAPLPGFQRTRLLGEAMGRFLNTLNKRVLILGSGGLSHPAAGAGAGEGRRPSARSPARRRKTAAAGRTRTAPAAGDQCRPTVYRRPPLAPSPQPGLGQPLYEPAGAGPAGGAGCHRQ
ncbi:2,3-dihydroxyphenylpropionate 1,2-dioxygenase [Klebsiella pneumoniae]|nr:2,3-dihydroxyphenylpropionate 1,2-dioxygenase [Klebsiella pneumoniae]